MKQIKIDNSNNKKVFFFGNLLLRFRVSPFHSGNVLPSTVFRSLFSISNSIVVAIIGIDFSSDEVTATYIV